MVTQKIYHAVIYVRLSKEDGDVAAVGKAESNSISNQKNLIKDFLKGREDIEVVSERVDDGYSGSDFNRPAFQRMISDIEAGRISCVITKDLSRLGRNYIESGSYMEVFFPKHNVRYIAITDNYDSLNKQEMDIAPFKNILNDMYSRDISKKVLAGRMTRSRQGKFCGGQPPLGLMRDPDDNGHLIIDPETAPIIRRIYDLALDGMGNMRICKVLMEERIPITRVQLLIDRRPPIMKGNNCPYYNIFHGSVYCATCGKSMQVRYEKVGRTDKDRRTGKEREPIDKAYYICQTYNRLGRNACTSHKIEARDLYNLVLSDIQEVAAMALKDKEAFYGRLSRRMEKQYLADTDSLKKEYESLAQRNQEIDDTFISLYADKAKGILTEKRFLKLTDAMEKEQESNQNRMQEIAALISEEEHSEGDVQMFMGEIRRYAAITELDETVLNRLINRILIGEPKKVDGVKTQEVRIVYNFVGEL